MCWSNATLFYGLWVTTASLNFAATAQKATRPPILAIDLISSRLRRGKLEIKKQDEKTTARELPEEVWELVKDELLGVAVRKAELDTLDGLRCRDCRQVGDGGCDCSACEELRGPSWTHWGHPNCRNGECKENAFESDLLWFRSPEQIEDIETLLKRYGLEMPSTEMWHENPEEYYVDFDSLSAISLPLRSTSSTTEYPTSRAEGMHDYGKGSSVLNFSPQSLLVSANVNRRFRRLISNYRLEVRDRTTDSVFPPNDPQLSLSIPSSTTTDFDDKKAVDKKKAEPKKKASKLFAKAEPRWMLWSLCEPCT